MTIPAAKVMELRSMTGAGMMDCKRALQESDGDLAKASDYLRKKGIAIAEKKSGRETNEGAVSLAFAEDHKTAAIVQLACETDFVALNDQFKAFIDILARQVLAKGDQDLTGQQLQDSGDTAGDRLTEEIGRLGENLRLIEARRMSLDGEGLIGGYVHSNGKIGVLVALSSQGGADRERLQSLAKDLAMHIAASRVTAITTEEVDPAVLEKEREILVAQAKDTGKPDNIIDKIVAGRLKKFVAESTLMSQPFVKDPDKTVAQMLAEAGQELGGSVVPVAFVKFQF